MTSSVKEPIQIYLLHEQIDALQTLAAQQGTTLEALVAQSVDALLTSVAPVQESSGEIPLEADPLWDIVGLGDAGVNDLAAEHDRYLVEFEEESNRPWPVKSL
jgi:hypothetical protein